MSKQRTRKPEDRTASHSVESCQNILKGHEDGMAHVKTSSNVGRGHGKHIGLLILGLCLHPRTLGIGLEASLVLPPLVDGRLECLRIVLADDAGRLVGLVVVGIVTSGSRSGSSVLGGCCAKETRTDATDTDIADACKSERLVMAVSVGGHKGRGSHRRRR